MVRRDPLGRGGESKRTHQAWSGVLLMDQIKIETPLPICEGCLYKNLTVKADILYGNDEVVARNDTVKCENVDMCRYIMKRLSENK